MSASAETPPRIRHLSLAAIISAAAVLTGCAGHDFEATASRPGKFQYYSCDQLDRRGGELLKRERELTALIDKARQGPGGEIAIALAYQNEYNTVKGDLIAIEQTGTQRNCVLKFRTVSEQAVR